MRPFRSILIAACLAGYLGAAFASPDAPVSGVDFATLRAPHQTASGARVEVLEFFSFPCPHCHTFDPMLVQLLAGRTADVALRRVHVAFGKKGDLPQRLYYTLESMGLADAMRTQVFKAIHTDGNKLRKEEAVFDLAAANGIDRQKFITVFRSADVDARVAAANAAEARYRIGQVPAVFVGGKYMTAPYFFHKQPSLYERVSNFFRGTAQLDAVEQHSTVRVVDALVAKELQENPRPGVRTAGRD